MTTASKSLAKHELNVHCDYKQNFSGWGGTFVIKEKILQCIPLPL